MISDLRVSLDQLLSMLASLNLDLWPAQFLGYALALAAAGLAGFRRPWASRAASGILAAMWLASALVYHLGYFSRLSELGYVFAALFGLQAALLLWDGPLKANLVLAPAGDGFMVMGALFMFWALAGHPWLSAYLGHPWPRLGLVGLAPGPTAAFTCGLLLWSRGRMPKRLLAIPALWSFLAFVLAVDLGLREEVPLLLVGLVSASLLLPRDLKPVI